MALYSKGYPEAQAALQPCRPSLEELIRKNREEAANLQTVSDAFKVIDDLGPWSIRDEIPGFSTAFLAAFGQIELRRSALATELEELLARQAEEESEK